MELKRALLRVRTVIGPKQALPLLSYAKLEIRGRKATLTGKGTNLAITLPIYPEECAGDGALPIYPEERSNDGAFLLPVKEILDILRGVEKHHRFVTLEHDDNKERRAFISKPQTGTLKERLG